VGVDRRLLGGAALPRLDRPPHALRPYGVTDIDMPATPERVWRALQGSEKERATAGTVSYGGTSTGSTGGAASPESEVM